MKKKLLFLLFFLLGILSYADVTSYDIKKIEIINSREIPEELILDKLKSKVGEKFNTENMISDYNAINQLKFIEKVSISPVVFENGVKLTVDITEKENTKKLLEEEGIIPLSEREQIDKSLVVSQIEIVGNSKIKTEEILNMLPLKTGAYFSKNKAIEGQKAIIDSGYFRDVTPNVVENKNGVKITYKVVENPVITGINIIGNTLYSTDELLKVIKTEPGKIFNINTVREEPNRIMKKYQDDGYVLAQVTDMGLNNKLELEIYLSEGIVRDIELKKMVTKQKGARRKANDDLLKTRDYVIEREIEIEKDKPFNIKDYRETSDNLMRLGHFKNVKYEPTDIPGDPDGKKITMLLDEERTAMLQGAISYGSEIGLLGTASIKDSNWKGRGQELGFTFEKSNSDYTSFSIDFFDPWIKDTDRISWGWSIYKTGYGDDDSPLFKNIDTIGAKFNIGKGLTKYTRLGLGAKFEYAKETSDHSQFTEDGYWKRDKSKKAEGLDDKYYIWSIFPSITYDSRNDYWNATRGNYAKLQLEGGYAGGYKADYFGNTTLELRKYHAGLFKKNTFAYRVVGGVMTDSTKEGQRFWVGGGNTLRGYDGGFFKGTKKVVGTIENRTEINDILGFVVFFDAGRAWEQNGRDITYTRDEKFARNVATTAGVGLRLKTPIGPLRFDFGWPVGNKMDKGMEFYFNMGQSF